MSFFKSWPGLLLCFLVGVVAAGLLTLGVLVHGITRPSRVHDGGIDFASLRMPVEEVTFEAPDGVRLAGWLLPGNGGGTAVVLCHDRGRSKGSLLNLMIRLHEMGCTTLALDFRAHGDSEGRSSTMGIHEGRDVLAAVDFLRARPGFDRAPIGLYGVGMGAHAAVLAAAERSRISVLVLDGLYPDVGYALARELFGDWQVGQRLLAPVARPLFEAMTGTSVADNRADDVLSTMTGREVLLVSPGDNAQLAAEIERMYERIPRTRETDGSLITLPVTQTRDLYGEEVDRYHSRVAGFFRERLLGVKTIARR